MRGLQPRATPDLTRELATAPTQRFASQRAGSYHSRWSAAARLNYNEILSDLIDAFGAWGEHEPEPTIEVADQDITITAATGRLWHCRDLLPNDHRRSVLQHIHHGETPLTEDTLSTYAQAARIMRQRIREAAAR